jgi:hypothetical protein
MKGMLAAILGLALATAAAAEEFPWQPTPSHRPVPVTLGRPVPATLGRPVPLPAAKTPARLDPGVVRASYSLPAPTAPVPGDPQLDLPLVTPMPRPPGPMPTPPAPKPTPPAPTLIPVDPPAPIRKAIPAGPLYTLPGRTRPAPLLPQPTPLPPPRLIAAPVPAPTPAPMPKPVAAPAQVLVPAPVPAPVWPVEATPPVAAAPAPAPMPPQPESPIPPPNLGDPWPDQDEYYTSYVEPIGAASPARLRVDAEFLTWWLQDAPLAAPLITAGTPTSLGILDRSGTSVLFGGSGLNYDAAPGFRLTAGTWLDPQQIIGVEASGFWVGQTSTEFAAGSNLNWGPVLARPVQNAITGLQTSQLISFPGAIAGAAEVAATALLGGFDTNLRLGLIGGGSVQASLLVGYRYLDLTETLAINQYAQLQGNAVSGFEGLRLPGPALVALHDSFRTRNQFNGGQLGLRTAVALGRFDVEMLAKVALGSTYQSVDITGNTAVLAPGRLSAVAPGGLLALPSNSGRFHDSAFAVVPEVGVTVGYQLTDNLRFLVGYNFLYWSNVVRPGDSINPLINPTQLPSSLRFSPLFGPAQPVATFQTRDFWAQGLTLGLVLRF